MQFLRRGTQAETAVCRIIADPRRANRRFAVEYLAECARRPRSCRMAAFSGLHKVHPAISGTRCDVRSKPMNPLGRIRGPHSDELGHPRSRVPEWKPSQEGRKGPVRDAGVDRTIGDVSPNYGAGQCTRTFVGPSAGATVARNVVARMSCPGEHSFPQATLASGFVSVKKIIMSLLWIPYVESLCFKSGCGLLNGGHSLPRGAREVWPSEVFADDKRLSCG